MKTVFRLILALSVSALAVWLWLVLFPSPEKIIIGQFEKLARAASVQPGEGSLARLAGAEKVGRFFSTNVQIDIDLPNRQQHAAMSREEIVQAVLAAHSAGGLKVKFPDINVTVASDQATAQADVTVEAKVPGEQDVLVQAMKFTLQKTDGRWLITRVQTVRTLS
ncbi:MAG: nuclear transport factor 2 family protein [Verrucomicrobiota bacterium]